MIKQGKSGLEIQGESNSVDKNKFVGGDVPEEALISNRVIFQHDIDCANRLKRLDKELSKLDFSDEWFDGINKDYLDMVEEANNTDLLLYWNVSRYLQELRNLKRALSPASTDNET